MPTLAQPEPRNQPSDSIPASVREILREKIPGTIVDFQDACLRLSGICASVAEIHKFADDGHIYRGLADGFQLLADCSYRVIYSGNQHADVQLHPGDLSTLADGTKLIENAREPLSKLADSLHSPFSGSRYSAVLTEREQGNAVVTTYLEAIEAALGKVSSVVA